MYPEREHEKYQSISTPEQELPPFTTAKTYARRKRLHIVLRVLCVADLVVHHEVCVELLRKLWDKASRDDVHLAPRQVVRALALEARVKGVAEDDSGDLWVQAGPSGCERVREVPRRCEWVLG